MQELATIFVTLVTFANTLAPAIGIQRVLAFNPLNPSQQVLSETDELNVSGISGEVSDIRGRKAQVKQRLEKARTERQQKIDLFRQRVQTTTTIKQQNREEFKEKLETIRDERKQEIVSKIDENLAKLNSKWVAQWNTALERLNQIVAKIETRAEAAASEGKDVARVQENISAAKTAINAAQDAVNTQSEKIYTITITTEQNLGQDVRTTINLFHNDIKNTKDAVDAAKRATVTALTSLKNAAEENENE